MEEPKIRVLVSNHPRERYCPGREALLTRVGDDLVLVPCDIKHEPLVMDWTPQTVDGKAVWRWDCPECGRAERAWEPSTR